MIEVTGHLERAKVKKIAERARKLLEGFGVECRLVGIKGKGFLSPGAKAVIVVGGDGSLLRIVRELDGKKPVLGVGAGKRNALMQVGQGKLKKAMKAIALGRFFVEKRARLEARVDGKRIATALNEAMVVNRKSGAIARLEVRVNAGKKKLVEADGLIVSTPTGSSGHAFSAGSKKLAIGCGKIAVVASNPLGRKFKALYVGGKSRIEVRPAGKGQECQAVIDGRITKKLGKKLVVGKGKPALFLVLGKEKAINQKRH